jgi:hypothetical protein
MAAHKIDAEHVQATSGRAYRYQARYEIKGPVIYFKAKILVTERAKILTVERVLSDPVTQPAAKAVRASMNRIIDETDFAHVECD